MFSVRLPWFRFAFLVVLALLIVQPISAQPNGPGAGDQWSRGKLRKMVSLIPPKEILAGGPQKDGIPALVDPHVIPATQASYLKPNDRVVGVVFGGEARAYPLRILVWHELANDVLGGMPIAVSYCPLCDSVMVFDREVGEQTREFGVSGKLYRSNVLMYDRQGDSAQESLWSQLMMKAVVGPAAAEGLELKALQSELTTWRDWEAAHPETTVLSLKTGHRRDYRGEAYSWYFGDDKIGYGTHGGSNRRPDLKNKDRVVVAEVGQSQRIYVVKDVVAAVADSEEIYDTLGGVRLQIVPLPDARSLKISKLEESDSEGAELRLAYSFWFAWEDLQPGVEIWEPEP